jgi:hypothetical protein
MLILGRQEIQIHALLLIIVPDTRNCSHLNSCTAAYHSSGYQELLPSPPSTMSKNLGSKGIFIYEARILRFSSALVSDTAWIRDTTQILLHTYYVRICHMRDTRAMLKGYLSQSPSTHLLPLILPLHPTPIKRRWLTGLLLLFPFGHLHA